MKPRNKNKVEEVIRYVVDILYVVWIAVVILFILGCINEIWR